MYPAIPYYLSETLNRAETMIPGSWLIAAIGAIASGIALVLGRKQGLRDATNNITLQSPVPEVPVKRVFTPPSFGQYMELVRRVEATEQNVAELRRDQQKQFTQMLEVGEKRKDDIIQRFDAVADGIHKRVDQFMLEARKAKH